MKKFIVLLLACVMAFSFSGCSKAGSDSKTLVLGTSADYSPFEFVILDDAGKQQYVGIDVSLAKQLAKDQGKELKVVNMNFKNLMASLQKGQVDMVIAAMEANDERKKVADFSDAYYTDLPPMVLCRADDAANYTSLDSFKDKKVGAQTGTTKADIVTKKMKGATLVSISSVNDLVNNLVYKKCDAIVLDGAVAQQYAKSDKTLKVAEVKLGDAYPYCVAVQKGDPKGLLKSFNKTIAKVTKDGSMDKWIDEANKQVDKEVKSK